MSDPANPSGAGAPPAQSSDPAKAPDAHPAAADPGAGTDAGNRAAVLEARVKELEGQLEMQVKDLTDRLLRAHAEMENLRKRTEREKADERKYAITKFATDIAGIADNFQRAVDAVPTEAAAQDAALKSFVEGVQTTERAFIQVLERHGVKRIDPQGEPFDPNKHQAVMEQHNAEVPSGTVVQVFQPGYLIEERVLRAAMVVVARGGAKVAKPANGNGEPPSGAANDDQPGPAGAAGA